MPRQENDDLAVTGDDNFRLAMLDAAHDLAYRNIRWHTQPTRHRIRRILLQLTAVVGAANVGIDKSRRDQGHADTVATQIAAQRFR